MSYNPFSLTPAASGNIVLSPNPLTGTGTLDVNTTLKTQNITSVGFATALNLTSDTGRNIIANSVFQTASGRVVKRTAVSGTTYTILASDCILGCTGLSAAVVLTLPAVASVPVGTTYSVKDEQGAALVNFITVSGNGAENIDGSNTLLFTSAYQSSSFYNNGTQWSVI